MKIRILSENHGTDRFPGEHGLSVYAEHQGSRYLLDTGSSGLFAENADRLGIDLSRVDMAFLSHGHYDHSGGFEEFFKRNERAAVFCQEKAFLPYYRTKDGGLKYIGVPEVLKERYGGRFRLLPSDRNCPVTHMGNGVYVLAHKRPLPEKGKAAGMWKIQAGKKETDDFSHEQSLVFDTEEGLYIFNSCCHGGADLVVREALEAFPGRKAACLLGGFHIRDGQDEEEKSRARQEAERVGRALKVLELKRIYTGHCTGEEAFDMLKAILGERLYQMEAGMEVDTDLEKKM